MIYRSAKSDVVEKMTPLDLWMTFPNFSLTIQCRSDTCQSIYFCDPYNLRNNLIYIKGSFKQFEILTPDSFIRNAYEEGGKSPKILPKFFLTYCDFKTTNNSISPKCKLSTSSSTVFNYKHISPKTMFVILTAVTDQFDKNINP